MRRSNGWSEQEQGSRLHLSGSVRVVGRGEGRAQGGGIHEHEEGGEGGGGWKGFEGEYCASATYETSAHKAAGSRPPPPPPPPPTHGITSTSGTSLNLAPPSGSRGAVETATYARLPMSRAVTRLPSRMTWYANTW